MLAIPTYWVRPPQVLSNAAGMHRFLWDMHYAPTPGLHPEYPIAAVYRNTAPGETSPWVMPGQYTVVLTANGQSETQPLTVQMDPRVKTPAIDLAQQFKLSEQLYSDARAVSAAMDQVASLRKQIDALQEQKTTSEVATALSALDKKLQALVPAEGRGNGGRNGGGEPKTLPALRGTLMQLMGQLQSADVAPTTQQATAVADLQRVNNSLMQNWETIKTQDVSALNAELRNAKIPELRLEKSSSVTQ
jgi:hypothetical protein